MTFATTLFLFVIFGTAFLMAYVSQWVANKKLLNPFDPMVMVPMVTSGLMATGITSILICLFNVYINYFYE